jgi:hypothetical protein
MKKLRRQNSFLASWRLRDYGTDPGYHYLNFAL